MTAIAGDGKGANVLKSEGNSVRLLPTGEEFYRELLSAVDNAKHFVCAEYYTVGTDSIGTLFLSHLAKKAAEGVKVYVMLDGYGSFCAKEHPMDKASMEEWRSDGLDIEVFNQYKVFHPLPRNHRKLTVIDGEVSFVGGMNVRDHYVDGTEELGEVNDLTVRIDGPASMLLVDVFEDDWRYWARHREFAAETGPKASSDDIAIDILPTSGLRGKPSVRQNYVTIIDGADECIRIVNGYFMPSAPIVSALRRAAGRDVKVDILMGETTDLPSYLHQRPFKIAKRLDRRDNISLHIYKGGFFHEKAMSVDGERLLVGSANLDLLSRLINRELCVLIYDEDITAQYDDIFDSYCAQ